MPSGESAVAGHLNVLKHGLRELPSRLDRSKVPVIVLVLGMLGFAAWIYQLGRGELFFYDEWSFVLSRRGFDLDAFLAPHNNHLSIVPVSFYKLLFLVVGLDHYGVYRLMVLASHLTCVGLTYVYCRRRIGDLYALAPAAIILFFGLAWQDFIWPFQIGFMMSLIGALSALLALDRRDSIGDRSACLALLVSLASSSVGVAFVVAVLLGLIWERESWKRLWIAAVPLLLYVFWIVTYSVQSSLKSSNADAVPGYVIDAASAAAGGLFGFGIGAGKVILAAFVLTVGIAVLRRRDVSARVATLAAAPLVFWVSVALSRAELGEPEASRYLYPGGLFLVLLAVEISPRSIPRWRWLVPVAVAVGIAVVSAPGSIKAGTGSLGQMSAQVGVELGALELVGARDPNFKPNPTLMPQVTAGPYLAAVDELGSPAYSLEEIMRQDDTLRWLADDLMVRSLRVGLVTADRVPAGDDRCKTLDPKGRSAHTDVELPASGLTVQQTHDASVEVRLRRFAKNFPTEPTSKLRRSGPVRLQVPADSLEDPWHARLTPTGQITICGV